MGRSIALIVITILIFLFDVYISKAILNIFPKWSDKRRKNFKLIYWGYSIFLVSCVFISIFFNMDIAIRTIILVAFFITFVSKLFFIPILFLDDIRRFFIWIKRRFSSDEQKVESENAI